MLDRSIEIIHKIKPGLTKYQGIMEKLNRVDVSQDVEFQRMYNGFYRVRQRSEAFYRTYYELMEKSKGKQIEFKDILEYLYDKLGRLEPSFSSKLFATLNPAMPIWDVFVLENLKLTKPAQNSKTKLQDTINLYQSIVEWYDRMLSSTEGKQIIAIFDEAYPDSGISDVKKIDFVLWQMRDKDSSVTILPDNFRGRSLKVKVIPTVCNLENMLKQLAAVQGDYAQLKAWQKRSYQAYQIDDIKHQIFEAPEEAWKDIIREHILAKRSSDFGAHVIDIYLVAYVAETLGVGKETFFKYILDRGISDKVRSAQAIWQVGKGDGVYLEILNKNGQVRDWEFMEKWIGQG